MAGPNFAPAVLWTLLALVVLVIVLIIVRIVRSMTFGTFVAGGRNRKTRLAVMDAAAVDSQRRLVLVRRDDTEHLILIGGPTDVVVERDIKLHSPARRPVTPTAEPPPPDAQARLRSEAPAAAPVAPRPEPRRLPAAATKAEPPPPPPPVYRASPPPPAASPPPAPRPAPARAPAANPVPEPNLSMARAAASPAITAGTTPRLKPFETSKPPAVEFGDTNKKPARMPELSLEDEMNRLLGELSTKK